MEKLNHFNRYAYLLVEILSAEYATISGITRGFEYFSTIITHDTLFMPAQIHKQR